MLLTKRNEDRRPQMDLYMNVANSIIHNSSKLERMQINKGRMNKLWHICTIGNIYSKNEATVTCDNVEGLRIIMLYETTNYIIPFI